MWFDYNFNNENALQEYWGEQQYLYTSLMERTKHVISLDKIEWMKMVSISLPEMQMCWNAHLYSLKMPLKEIFLCIAPNI